MEIIIRNSDSQPIYEQIVRQLKAQIIAGELTPGALLPSIRGLAKDLHISVITTKRAYDELAAEGFLNNVPGKGCFVAEKDAALLREQQYRELEAHISAAVELSRRCGIEERELTELLHTLWEEE